VELANGAGVDATAAIVGTDEGAPDDLTAGAGVVVDPEPATGERGRAAERRGERQGKGNDSQGFFHGYPPRCFVDGAAQIVTAPAVVEWTMEGIGVVVRVIP
jgi:hypothetical protein